MRAGASYRLCVLVVPVMHMTHKTPHRISIWLPTGGCCNRVPICLGPNMPGCQREHRYYFSVYWVFGVNGLLVLSEPFAELRVFTCRGQNQSTGLDLKLPQTHHWGCLVALGWSIWVRQRCLSYLLALYLVNTRARCRCRCRCYLWMGINMYIVYNGPLVVINPMLYKSLTKVIPLFCAFLFNGLLSTVNLPFEFRLSLQCSVQQIATALELF